VSPVPLEKGDRGNGKNTCKQDGEARRRGPNYRKEEGIEGPSVVGKKEGDQRAHVGASKEQVDF